METATQTTYAPRSKSNSVGTLTPTALKGPIERALADLEANVGDIDQYVAEKVGFRIDQLRPRDGSQPILSAEQIDAVALAVAQVERGSSFIIGDQTGVGKGRFVASMIKYAHRQGLVPVFMTMKPGLYGDMVRDLSDIGHANDVAELTTNTNLRGSNAIDTGFPDADGNPRKVQSLTKKQYDEAMAHIQRTGTMPDGLNALFTTYDQMNTKKGEKVARHHVMEAIAPNAMFILDESHNAAGQPVSERQSEDDNSLPRSQLIRELLAASGRVIYSSATYAKNPHAMTLYSQTDIGKVEADPTILSETIRRGGVPLQQVLAEMISEAGQYTRREKSFDGINFTAQMADVPEAISNANSEMIARMFRADLSLADYRDTIAESMLAQGMVRGVDPGVAMEAADSNTFASTIHNIVGQMFLSMKSNDVADRAVEAIERGEAPVVTVANTFGAILDQYVTEAGIETGGDVSGISFGSVLERYLDRIRRISFKDPANDAKRIHVHISDKMLVDAGAGEIAKQFGEIRKAIRADKNIQDMPGSPIDAIRRRINEAGYSVGELTGRNLFISNNNTLEQRDNSDSQKAQMIRSFNAGQTDALIINRAVAAGYSMHASERNPEAGQKKRLMILAQPEANVDNFMQILGRVNRQGQIVKPEYAMIVSSDPAERRTVAQIMKKLASLNANTTGGRKSAIDVDAVDIMNIYGDRIAAQFIEENPQIGRKVDLTKPSSQNLPGFASKLTGRSVLLTPKERTYLWDTLEARYTDLIEGLNATGQNVLEATTLPLEARTVERSVFVEANPDVANGPFAEPAYMEKVNVKALGKPMTIEETTTEIEKSEYSEAKKDAWLKSAYAVVRERIKEADERTAALEKAASADGVSPAKKQDINKKIYNANDDKINARDALSKITEQLSLFSPGNYYSITSHVIDENGDIADGGENVNARLIDIRRSGDDAGALAPSNYNLVFGLASGARRMNISLSGVLGGDVSIYPSRAATYEADVTEFFRSGREDRWMVTGNVFAGFNEMGGKGQITRFTDENGGVRAGILMKRGFDPVKAAGERPVRFTSQEAQRFLEMVPRAQIKSRDGFVKIGYANVRAAETGGTSDYLVTIDRKAGAAVKNAEQIRRHTVEGQFSTRRGKPWTAKVEPHKFQDFLDAMRDTADVVFQTDSHKDEANTVVGQSPSAEAGQPQYQRPYMSVPRKPVYRSRGTDAYTPKRSFMQDRNRVAGRIKDIGRRIFGDGLNIQTVDRLYDDSGREVFGVYYSQGIPGGAVEHIAAIAVDRQNIDPIATLGHEGFHYLEQMGAFSDAEMSVLRKKARQWLRTFRTAQRYPKRDDHTRDQYNAMLQREAMADAYGEYLSGQDQGEAQSIFDKINDFIERLGNWLRGNGYQSARDIFDAIGQGDYAFTSADGSIVQAMYQRGDQTPGRRGGVNQIAEEVSSRVERTPESAQRAVKNARNWLKDTYDPSNRLPNTRQLGWFAKTFAHPATIASMFKRFAPVYESVQKQFERREQLTQKYAELAGRYLTGANATREKVNKALAAGRLQKRELPDSALRQDFGLDGEGIAMYRSVRHMLNAALDDFKNVIYATYDVDTSDGARPTAQELRDMAESETGQRAKELEAAAEKIDEIDRATREGYVPFSRYGQIGIAVRETKEDGETEVIHYEMVETDLSRGPVGRAAGRRLNQARVKEVRDRLLRQYGNMPNVEVTEPFEVREAPPDINEVSLGMVDQLAKIGGADAQEYAEVRDALDKAIQKATFRRHWIRSRDVAGYSMDFQRVIADYINGISTYIARHETRPDIEKSYGEIDISKQRSLSQYAREYIEYAQAPQEEFQNFRHATFFMYLAGNISSAVVNLSQVPVVTFSYLGMFANPARVSREFARAYKETAAMVSWPKGSMFPSFDLSKAPADVMPDLIRTDQDGLLNPQVSHEMVGLAAGQRRFLREQRQSVGNVMDKFIALYSAAERVNRVVTFIAVHRLGRDQKIMDKAKRVLSANELVALRMREGEFGPTELARQTIEDTHFRQGKGNRQVISRGLGAPMLQFMSFITNALELQYKMASQHGVEGMKGLGMMAGMLILTTGIYGLPFGDDMKDLIEKLVSWARSRDLDIEQSVYDAFEGMGAPGAAAEIFQRGLLRQLGIDVSRRIGMGNIVPSAADPLGSFVPFDMTYGRATRMMDHMKQDRYLEASGELMPLFLKNPVQAGAWSQDGVRTRYGSTAIPAHELTGADLFAKSLGFNPTSVARGRELQWAQTRAQTAADEYRRNFYTRFSSAITDRVQAQQGGNERAARRADDSIARLLGEIQSYNESVTPSEMIILSTPHVRRAIRRRVQQNMMGPEQARRVRRQARERFSEIAQTRSNLGLLSGIMSEDLSNDAREAYGAMSQGQAPAAVRVLEQLSSQ